jgi:hypothetical protein
MVLDLLPLDRLPLDRLQQRCYGVRTHDRLGQLTASY